MRNSKMIYAALAFALLAFAGGYLLGQAPGRGSFEVFTPDIPDTPVLASAEPSTVQIELDDRDKKEQKGLLCINTASAAELADLPGIGTVLAQRIVDYREENGPFSDIVELAGVKGIGEKLLENIRDYITVDEVKK